MFSSIDHLPVKDNMTDKSGLSYDFIVYLFSNTSLYINHRSHVSLESTGVGLWLSFMNWRVEMTLVSLSCDKYACFLQQFWKMLPKW